MVVVVTATALGTVTFFEAAGRDGEGAAVAAGDGSRLVVVVVAGSTVGGGAGRSRRAGSLTVSAGTSACSSLPLALSATSSCAVRSGHVTQHQPAAPNTDSPLTLNMQTTSQRGIFIWVRIYSAHQWGIRPVFTI